MTDSGEPRKGNQAHISFIQGRGTKGASTFIREPVSELLSMQCGLSNQPTPIRRKHGMERNSDSGVGSTLTAVVTSNTATGSYNRIHNSYRSLG